MTDHQLATTYLDIRNTVLQIQYGRRRSRRGFLVEASRKARAKPDDSETDFVDPASSEVSVRPRKVNLSAFQSLQGDDQDFFDSNDTSKQLRPTIPSPKIGKKVKIAEQTNSTSVEELFPVVGISFSTKKKDRVCLLCGSHKENNEMAGRLLFLAPDSWVHAYCAIWSAEVFEQKTGELSNIERTLSKASKTFCSICKKHGASVICCSKGCGVVTHFRCAKKHHFAFLVDCTSFCTQHRPRSALGSLNKGLLPARLCRKLLLKSDSDVDSRGLRIRIGSLTILSLGSVIPNSLSFHGRDHIYPLGFTSARIWWSYKSPGHRVVYHCHIASTERRNPNNDVVDLFPEFLIVPSDDSDEPIREATPSEAWVSLTKRLKNFRTRNGKRKKLPNGDMMSFELRGSVFFGFGHPMIQRKIEQLPHADSCVGYEFKKSCPEAMDVDSENPAASQHCLRVEGFDPSCSHSLQSSSQCKCRVPVERLGPDFDLAAESLISSYRKMKQGGKVPVVRRSNIHGVGLFAAQTYDAGDVITEFIGEIIRNALAEVREKEYERKGIGSCLMFRMDEDTVIDGTERGNMTRYINHSCDPNCFSRVIVVDESKKIVICASRQMPLENLGLLLCRSV
eukprot:TRINITY_DN1124_c0_g1_i12.p1 TRINITY_DN1124_c0_g1~~TRINITY_DN1124_c0_g1_i12.p1  ORF type:complete len:655 (+),score=107.52 TRINITY_DN1124_c0_g1_i12:104-1966(+)